MIKIGTILLAKDWHPERVRGGSGVAIVVEEANDSSFIMIEWIESVCNPYAPVDVVAINSLNEGYDIIDDSLRDKYVSKEWKSTKMF